LAWILPLNFLTQFHTAVLETLCISDRTAPQQPS